MSSHAPRAVIPIVLWSYPAEPPEKAKGKPKRDQTVRLSDDGELVFTDEDEALHDAAASGESRAAGASGHDR